ncbi:OmpA/MotB family protein [Pengzhenrongella frigida]|uniref:Flagellar motor protein MotB n=1 Tax=Pengzhenrongella frigida TaxID=1259133 RepID=A0A4V1ZGX0_9MICO|nr:flagellar motor protein MotB [Cellulomonas sp. HLT2-17]RYV50014.1 flagellar motor protein MotB [Cellulomonas sp. HLT2-17]
MSGRKPKVHEEEHENHERWAVSYADMMTVLVGLFIVMYAMSQVDQTKFEALAGSLAAGFGNASPTVLTGASGIMKDAGAVPASIKPAGETNPIAPAAELTEDAQNLVDARAELARLEAMRDQIEANLVAAGVGQQVSYGIDSRGLIVGLIANDFFFETGSAVLKPAAQTVLNATGPAISSIPDEISVEGHADAIPISGRYPTNWELSADRATQVLRHLVEVDGIAGSRISAVSFGDARPLTSTDGSDSLAINRRVDLVIRSPLAEPVRALLPIVIAANEG